MGKRALVAFLKRGREERKGEGKGDKRPPPTGFPEEDKREEDGDRRKPKGDRDGDRKGDRKDDGPTGEPDIERRQEPTGETPRGDKQEKKRPNKGDMKRALVAFLKRGREERKGEGKGDKRPPPTGFPEEDKCEEGGDRRK